MQEDMIVNLKINYTTSQLEFDDRGRLENRFTNIQSSIEMQIRLQNLNSDLNILSERVYFFYVLDFVDFTGLTESTAITFDLFNYVEFEIPLIECDKTNDDGRIEKSLNLILPKNAQVWSLPDGSLLVSNHGKKSITKPSSINITFGFPI